MGHKKIIDEIKQSAPELAKLKSSLNYEIPEAYFAGLSDTLLKQVNPPKAKPISLFRKLSPFIISTAASVVLLLGVYSLMKPSSSPVDSSSLYYDYVMDNLDEYEEENLLEIGFSEVALNDHLQSVSDEALEKFLSDDNYLLEIEE